MSERFDPYSALYERGVAVGSSDVQKDAMVFRFRDEVFEFPTLKAFHLARWNGYFYEASVDDIRKLEAEASG